MRLLSFVFLQVEFWDWCANPNPLRARVFLTMNSKFAVLNFLILVDAIIWPVSNKVCSIYSMSQDEYLKLSVIMILLILFIFLLFYLLTIESRLSIKFWTKFNQTLPNDHFFQLIYEIVESDETPYSTEGCELHSQAYFLWKNPTTYDKESPFDWLGSFNFFVDLGPFPVSWRLVLRFNRVGS